MATTKAQKQQILASLTEEFKTAGSAVFTTYSGLTVSQFESLRRELREADVRVVVAKKTLINLAAKAAGFEEIPAENMEGPIAVAFAHGDELAAAQALHKFGKKNEQVTLTGGVMDGAQLSTAEVRQLATLPSREGLLGQLVGLLASPMRGVAGIGHSILSGTARVLSEIEKKKAADAA